MLRCTVTDSGKGISPAQHNRLFDLRICSTEERQLLGISLGLYFCQRIIVAHGGKIGVISTVGQGTKLWFTLPLKNLGTNLLL
ncbi:MAG: hypothetical protein HC772_01185 [Leptolyngbyaceae cyanobacterium CRU_2_3]|nr:hypothetical protein [Leptolyngbyaceae cyanobacterium CRU_2_3]